MKLKSVSINRYDLLIRRPSYSKNTLFDVVMTIHEHDIITVMSMQNGSSWYNSYTVEYIVSTIVEIVHADSSMCKAQREE